MNVHQSIHFLGYLWLENVLAIIMSNYTKYLCSLIKILIQYFIFQCYFKLNQEVGHFPVSKKKCC